jgi:hypothetical protein
VKGFDFVDPVPDVFEQFIKAFLVDDFLSGR